MSSGSCRYRRIACRVLAVLSTFCLTIGTASGVPKKGVPVLPSERSPDAYTVRIETAKGDIVVEVRRAIAPNSADRFYNLVRSGGLENSVFLGGVVSFGKLSNDCFVVAPGWLVPLLSLDLPVCRVKAGDLVFKPSLEYVASNKTRWGIQADLGIATDSSIADYLSGCGAAPFGRIVQGSEVLDKLNMVPSDVPTAWGAKAYTKKHPDHDVVSRMTVMEGVATDTPQSSSAMDSASSVAVGPPQLTIYRPDRSGCSTIIEVDGVACARLKEWTAFTTSLPAGRHVIVAKARLNTLRVALVTHQWGTGWSSHTLDLRPGQRSFLVAEPWGGNSQNVRLYPVAPDFGAEDSARLPQVEPAK
jgi:cyclophilin family peptidyl-prolyl cis-trans isomerase